MKIDEHRFKQIMIKLDEHRSNMWMSNMDRCQGAGASANGPLKPPIMEDLYYQFLVVLGMEYHALGIPVYSRTWANDFVL